MNIWQALSISRDHEKLTLDGAKRLYDNLCLAVPNDRDRFISIMERRTDQTWLVCEASDLVFPDWQQAPTVGDSEGTVLFLPWLQSDQDEYVYARHRCNEWGWCDRDSTQYADCNDEYITNQEYEWNYGTCDHCEEVFHQNDLYYNESHDAHFCADHDPGEPEDEDPNPRGTIRNYNTDVLEAIPVHLDRKTRYFGLEIEMEFPGETPSYWAGWADDHIPDLSDWAIWKSDGSLNNGAELVTIPCTLESWRDDNPIKDLCNDQAFRKVAKSHNTRTCGLHIHVSRSTVPEPVIAKLQVLMNDPSMMETTTLIARRAPNTTYCSAQKKKWLSHTNYHWEQAKGEYESGYRSKPELLQYVRPTKEISKTQFPQHGRYSPVNLTDKTLEFRIFRGTLRWETILASIEFCDATIWFAKTQGCADMNAAAFNQFLRSAVTRKTYPALRDYLELRTVLPKRKAAPPHDSAKPDTMTACHSVPTVGPMFTVCRSVGFSHLYLVHPEPVRVYNGHSNYEVVLNPEYRDSLTMTGCESTTGAVPYVTAVRTVADVPERSMFTQWMGDTWSGYRYAVNPVPDLNLDIDPYQGRRQIWPYATDEGANYLNYPGDHFQCDLDEMRDVERRFVRLVDRHDNDLVIDCVNLSEISHGYIMWGPARTCSLRFN